jgi:Domain of unknown function (DUF309)
VLGVPSSALICTPIAVKPTAFPHPPAWWADVRAGAQCYDDGHYWDAHEHWERAWKAHLDLHRHYLKGLIQLTAVCHHLARGKPRAARALLDRGPMHLADNHPLSWPFDTAHLLTVAAVLARSIDRGGSPRPPKLGLVGMMDAWAAEHLPA